MYLHSLLFLALSALTFTVALPPQIVPRNPAPLIPDVGGVTNALSGGSEDTHDPSSSSKALPAPSIPAPKLRRRQDEPARKRKVRRQIPDADPTTTTTTTTITATITPAGSSDAIPPTASPTVDPPAPGSSQPEKREIFHDHEGNEHGVKYDDEEEHHHPYKREIFHNHDGNEHGVKYEDEEEEEHHHHARKREIFHVDHEPGHEYDKEDHHEDVDDHGYAHEHDQHHEDMDTGGVYGYGCGNYHHGEEEEHNDDGLSEEAHVAYMLRERVRRDVVDAARV